MKEKENNQTDFERITNLLSVMTGGDQKCLNKDISELGIMGVFENIDFLDYPPEVNKNIKDLHEFLLAIEEKMNM